MLSIIKIILAAFRLIIKIKSVLKWYRFTFLISKNLLWINWLLACCKFPIIYWSRFSKNLLWINLYFWYWCILKFLFIFFYWILIFFILQLAIKWYIFFLISFIKFSEIFFIFFIKCLMQLINYFIFHF